MEEYRVENGDLTKENITIEIGDYCNKVYDKHVDTYDESGAENIWDNIYPTFRKALEQYEDENMNNNMLLVGKIQSGKTSNLEMFTALALDNGYNMVVIYGGYDNTLLSQTIGRFAEAFDIPNEMDFSEPSPVILSSKDCELLAEDNEIMEYLLNSEKPIFIISMKRPDAIKKVNKLLSIIDKTELKAFIIDDEADQASLNTEIKKNKASATYASICKMKDYLGDPLYLSVTATAQALVLLDDDSRLRPDSVRVITPGKGYYGADAYQIYDDIIEIIDEKDKNDLSNGKLADSLREAIIHFIISSAIMHIRGCDKSEMIVHTHRKISDHNRIIKLVDAYINARKAIVKYNDPENLKTVKEEFENVYIKMFKEEVISQYEFDNIWNIIKKNIINNVFPILKNSTGKKMEMREKMPNRIYVGGDLLQRGVSFDNLVTTYFTRWAKDGGNMDTNLQRERWFGYNEKYIDICKIFTTSEISREFMNLAEMETDLWEQFREVQEGEMEIKDIHIKAEDTNQKPTRPNVASYKKYSFNGWIIQRFGIFDANQVKNNKQLIEDLLENSSFNDTSNGRTDDKKTAEYACIEKEKLGDLIDHIQTVFDMEPLKRKLLKDLFETYEEIPVLIMKGDEKGLRRRSFSQDTRISDLHQGRDNVDPAKAIYQGDRHVIIDATKINIQIHKILPMREEDKKELKDYIQYMFAIYVPEKKQIFVRG